MKYVHTLNMYKLFFMLSKSMLYYVFIILCDYTDSVLLYISSLEHDNPCKLFNINLYMVAFNTTGLQELKRMIKIYHANMCTTQ